MERTASTKSIDGARLRVRLTPRGGRDAVFKWESGVLYARVAAPPVDGAANKALIALLANVLDVPKSAITFQSGETGRDKVLRLDGLNDATLLDRIHAVLTA